MNVYPAYQKSTRRLYLSSTRLTPAILPALLSDLSSPVGPWLLFHYLAGILSMGVIQKVCQG